MYDEQILQTALLNRAVAALGIPSDQLGPPDDKATFWDGFSIGDHVFDSVDLLEMVVVFEQELQVKIVDAMQFEGVGNMGELVAYLQRAVPAPVIDEFCEKWAVDGRVA